MGAPLEQRATFNKVAGLYGSARPGYADALVADVIAFAQVRPGDRVLEVGCGAGQATTSFAHKGFQLVALDPGDTLLNVARERVGDDPNVHFVHAPFEAWDAGGARFRLIFAAQAWHWIPPDVSFTKAADLLQASGALAVFGHVPGALSGPLAAELETIYRRYTGQWGPPPEAGYLPSGPHAGWFDASGRFESVVHKRYDWMWRHTAASFVDFARTRSDHQMLPEAVREALLADVKGAIVKNAGAFDWPYETHLYMARVRR
jgi:ubiquinone/menaquinone biosynthesis C-methylase UbiE